MSYKKCRKTAINILFRYYLEPSSPLKSINTTTQEPFYSGISKPNQPNNNLAALKNFQLTPPASNIRPHHGTLQQQKGNFGDLTSTVNIQNKFKQQNLEISLNGSINSDEFVADFSKASIYNSNSSLNITDSGSHAIKKVSNGISSNDELSANFADFENNKIYNAAGE